MDSVDRCNDFPPGQEVEAHGAGFRALGSDAMADCLLGILRHNALELGLGLFVFEVGGSGATKVPANSAQALEEVMSTIRAASMRGATCPIEASSECLSTA
jgi:hypothetical protein